MITPTIANKLKPPTKRLKPLFTERGKAHTMNTSAKIPSIGSLSLTGTAHTALMMIAATTKPALSFWDETPAKRPIFQI